MSKVSKEFIVFLFVVIVGMGMLFMNARTYADLGVGQSLADATNTPMSNYLPMVLKSGETPTPTTAATAVVDPTVMPTGTSTSIPTAGDIRIIYIEYDPAIGSDVDGEYVDIQNMGGTTQDMTGWILQDNASVSYAFPAISLSPTAMVRIWTKSGTNTATNLYIGRGSAIWNNGGDTATLLDADSQVVDVCTYAGGGTGFSCP